MHRSHLSSPSAFVGQYLQFRVSSVVHPIFLFCFWATQRFRRCGPEAQGRGFCRQSDDCSYRTNDSNRNSDYPNDFLITCLVDRISRFIILLPFSVFLLYIVKNSKPKRLSWTNLPFFNSLFFKMVHFSRVPGKIYILCS